MDRSKQSKSQQAASKQQFFSPSPLQQLKNRQSNGSGLDLWLACTFTYTGAQAAA
jgi:hypothetical protein